MPRKANFEHPAKTVDERMLRKEANNTRTNADIAREYGYKNIGNDLDRVAEQKHKQADDMANKRKGG